MNLLIATAVKCAHGSVNTNCRNLPHTGFDLLIILPIAVLLVLLGVALYRAGRSADIEQ